MRLEGRRTPLAEHRLDHQRGDVLRRDLVLEHRLELRVAVRGAGVGIVRVRQRARQRIWVWRDVDLRKERAVTAAVLGLRGGERRGPGGAAMEPPAERDDRLSIRGLTSELDRRLDRFRAAVPEERGIQPARCHGREHLGERDARLVLGHPRGDVHEARHLVGDGLDDARMRVADDRDGDAAGQIEDPPTVRGEQPASLATIEREPGVVTEHGREDLARARLEGGHRDHSIGCSSCGRGQPGRRSSVSDVTRICSVARSSPITRTR